MREDEVLVKLNSMLSSRFDKKLDNVRLYDANLLNDEIGLSPLDLLILYLDIEAEFDVVIPQQSIAENKFTTINQIKDIILSVK